VVERVPVLEERETDVEVDVPLVTAVPVVLWVRVVDVPRTLVLPKVLLRVPVMIALLYDSGVLQYLLVR
jgi:hypothetical protein